MKNKIRLIGSHTSAAGGAYKALLQGQEIGATTIQLFTANQRQWQGKALTKDSIWLFKQKLKETGLQSIMSHASYLINLGSPDEMILHKSREAFREEIRRCQALGISFLNFHPGAALQSSQESCLERIVASIRSMEDILQNSPLKLLIETTAGQGSTMGSNFDEIGYLIAETANKIPVGVCIDTCHIYAAGYDIRSHKGWEDTLKIFEQKVGINFLEAFHLNDSLKALGSKKDRHAPLGKGEIGLDSFKYLMQNEKTTMIPKYLETPGGPSLWVKEIALLRQWQHDNR